MATSVKTLAVDTLPKSAQIITLLLFSLAQNTPCIRYRLLGKVDGFSEAY